MLSLLLFLCKTMQDFNYICIYLAVHVRTCTCIYIVHVELFIYIHVYAYVLRSCDMHVYRCTRMWICILHVCVDSIVGFGFKGESREQEGA